MANLVQNPYPMFTDVDGDPLESGYVYIGEANKNPKSNPLQSYWNAELTIPASNIRTKGGYPSYNGSPGRLYTGENYSILVEDKKGRLVFSQLDSVDYFNTPSGNVILKAATIADLRGMIPTDENVIVSVGGYHSIGDGGGGPDRYWDPLSTEDDDGGSVIKPTLIGVGDPGRWKWQAEYPINVKWFGATGDGLTDDADAIQTTQDYVYASGRGVVYCPAGVYIIGSTISQDDEIIIEGDGIGATDLKLADSANTAMIKSRNFGDLSVTTGGVTNKWLISDGVGYGHGLRNLSLDGNRTYNTSGNGVNYYSKRYIVDNVLIREVAGKGFYTECGDVGGQDDFYKDMPECSIGKLWIRGTGNEGFHYRGPHDGRIDWLVVANSGKECILLESLSDVYSADPDIGYVHCYGSGSGTAAMKTTSPMRGEHLIVESGSTNAFLATNNLFELIIGTMKAFKGNQGGGGDPVVKIASSNNVIGDLFIKDNNGGGGLLVDGAYTSIGNLLIDGQSSGSTGLEINKNNCRIAGYVKDFSAAGGTGFKITNGDRNKIDLSIESCETGFQNADGDNSFYNEFDFIFALGGNGGTAFVGNGKTDRTSMWHFNGVDVNGNVRSVSDVLSDVIDISAAATINVAVPHLLATAPDKNKCQISITDVVRNADYSLGWIIIGSVDSTYVNVSVRVDSGTGTAGNRLKLNVHSEI